MGIKATSVPNSQYQRGLTSVGYAVSKNNTESQQDGDACGSRSQNVPIFIRHCSGLVELTLNLDESLEHMMNLYEHKTKTKVANRYFSYGPQRIKLGHTLRFYGIARNTTVNLIGTRGKVS